MLRNYFKIAIRNLFKHKTYSVINILGLVIGITCFLLVMLWVQYELGYDRYIKNSDRIYRIGVKANLGETRINTINTPGPLGKDMVENHSEVEGYVRFALQYNSFVSYGETMFIEKELAGVDKNIFDFFEIPLIKGEKATALADPNSICISQRAAEKYFGNDDPVGKIVRVDNKRDFKITGVFKDFPENSHINLTLLASISSFESGDRFTSWGSFNCITYLIFKPGTTPGIILPKYTEKIINTIGFKKQVGALSGNDKLELYSQKITDIHLNSNSKDEFKANGDISQIYIFTSIALFILLIACINFVNLSTAKSALRAKEVAIRKTVGSNKIQIVKQFLGESIAVSVLSLLISLVVVEILLPEYRNFVQRPLEIHYFDNFITIPFLLGLALAIGFFSGIYPAFYLSSFKPVAILKGNTKSKVGGSRFRNNLVIFQFSISILFFVGTLVVHNQLEYIKNKNLGFGRDNVLVLFTPESYHAKIDLLREKLQKNPSIVSVSNSHSVPGTGADFTQVVYKPEGKDILMINTTECDYDYNKTFNLGLVQGRFFSREFVSDTSSSILINESAAKMIGWTDPVGKILTWSGGKSYTVIGVLKDFNFESLHKTIKPMALIMNVSQRHWLNRFTSIKIHSENIPATLEYIKASFKEVSGTLGFRYMFLEERYERLYQSEQEAGRLFVVFSFIAIFVACLGLLGLVTFATEQRTKEVAVRKILGANLSELFVLLSKESIKWVILANIFAWPIAYFMMNKWLEGFAYRINLGIVEFVLAGIMAAIIALVTVSFQVLKVANSNPVDSLKYE
jgi:putative ABC transport system permease protein